MEDLFLRAAAFILFLGLQIPSNNFDVFRYFHELELAVKNQLFGIRKETVEKPEGQRFLKSKKYIDNQWG